MKEQIAMKHHLGYVLFEVVTVVFLVVAFRAAVTQAVLIGALALACMLLTHERATRSSLARP